MKPPTQTAEELLNEEANREQEPLAGSSGHSISAAALPSASSILSPVGSLTQTVRPFSPTPSATVFRSEGSEDEDTEEPAQEYKVPIVVFKQVAEEDALYTKLCKVFVRKDSAYEERGVGVLHLMPVAYSPNAQLVVRANDIYGPVLINLIVASGMPCQRMGTNNIMIMGLPVPEDTKVVAILLRVKQTEDADELFGRIQKYSK